MAFRPQVPGHGSWHLFIRHACVNEHSALTIHSGLQDGGAPIRPGWQEQTACPSVTRQILFWPQGEGLHGSISIIEKL